MNSWCRLVCPQSHWRRLATFPEPALNAFAMNRPASRLTLHCVLERRLAHLRSFGLTCKVTTTCRWPNANSARRLKGSNRLGLTRRYKPQELIEKRRLGVQLKLFGFFEFILVFAYSP